jgi:uncharacterized protein DUF397
MQLPDAKCSLLTRETAMRLEDQDPSFNGMPADQLRVRWGKSARSSAQGNCVETARLADGEVAMRNSRHPSGPALIFSQAEARAFLEGVKDGDFDHLLL